MLAWIWRLSDGKLDRYFMDLKSLSWGRRPSRRIGSGDAFEASQSRNERRTYSQKPERHRGHCQTHHKPPFLPTDIGNASVVKPMLIFVFYIKIPGIHIVASGCLRGKGGNNEKIVRRDMFVSHREVLASFVIFSLPSCHSRMCIRVHSSQQLHNNSRHALCLHSALKHQCAHL